MKRSGAKRDSPASAAGTEKMERPAFGGTGPSQRLRHCPASKVRGRAPYANGCLAVSFWPMTASTVGWFFIAR
jgi:hypothetical protein